MRPFFWAFGLWDICYYVWLWVILRWPASLLDFDVLFLIPLPWIGPVLAPGAHLPGHDGFRLGDSLTAGA